MSSFVSNRAVTAPGTVIFCGLAGSLFGSFSSCSSRSLRGTMTGQPCNPDAPTGATWTAVTSGSVGAMTSTGATPSTVGPENLTAVLVPRFNAIGRAVVAQGKSPTRRR